MCAFSYNVEKRYLQKTEVHPQEGRDLHIDEWTIRVLGRDRP